ncbi:MAG: nucleotide sugar dehydrogenase [bacterium]|uniref:UDP-glucose 6-dehydrogenase n=2 Tax=Bacteria candidate phyla TaxID=1783234 RepID=A0A101I414_UNCT6|nr:MAG: Nucleotide sugar dehydrogenase [candidate division TA06 bacterium 32_111]KUK87495.1 MAG: Nucleotide sugar dehydrogenase [candidate division TA06 bacterium 34_109]MDI6700351.1 nucleotide sugar dehydrogenase [bacterium]HAF08168.1 GDP-mannose dehydrogenase [candidate division WOR-3 bacterium]HCP16730.1 GDP-mannose dehydrogenase [candidate division WOR-3 bacterium]
MKIAVFGLGYVGIISAACLAEQGYKVIGVEVNDIKINEVNNGRSPIVEPYVNEIVSKVVKSGNLEATDDFESAVKNSNIALICVGTPSSETGEVDLSFIFKTAQQIADALRKKENFESEYVILIRSTSMPGTVDKFAEVVQSISGKKRKKDFDVVSNPEFLREGNAVNDFYNPPFTLLGCECERSEKIVRQIYSFLEAPFIVTSVKTAEMLKYVNNTFHGLKVGFANEIARICRKKGIDSREVMELFLLDKKLNISEYYLRPGFAFGGSCLPKDVRALSYESKKNGLSLPIIENIMNSNSLHIEWAFDIILKEKVTNIGVMGITFKNGTDDLRESPAVVLVEKLLGKGKNVLVYDENVRLSKLVGSNREYIEREIKHISEILIEDQEKFLDSVDLVVITNRENSYRELLNSYQKKELIIVDLVNIFPEKRSSKNYKGIGW